MKLSEYVKLVCEESKASEIKFDLGLHPSGNDILVDDKSKNRIKFTLIRK